MASASASGVSGTSGQAIAPATTRVKAFASSSNSMVALPTELHFRARQIDPQHAVDHPVLRVAPPRFHSHPKEPCTWLDRQRRIYSGPHLVMFGRQTSTGPPVLARWSFPTWRVVQVVAEHIRNRPRHLRRAAQHVRVVPLAEYRAAPLHDAVQRLGHPDRQPLHSPRERRLVRHLDNQGEGGCPVR